MRQVLVDAARRRRAAQRGGGGERVTLAGDLEVDGRPEEQLLDVDAALVELAALDPRQARIVELRFFVGLEVREIADALEVSISRVEREWRAARAWLGRRIGDGGRP